MENERRSTNLYPSNRCEFLGFQGYLQRDSKTLDRVNMVAEPWSRPEGTRWLRKE